MKTHFTKNIENLFPI